MRVTIISLNKTKVIERFEKVYQQPSVSLCLCSLLFFFFSPSISVYSSLPFPVYYFLPFFLFLALSVCVCLSLCVSLSLTICHLFPRFSSFHDSGRTYMFLNEVCEFSSIVDTMRWKSRVPTNAANSIILWLSVSTVKRQRKINGQDSIIVIVEGNSAITFISGNMKVMAQMPSMRAVEVDV